MPTSDTPDSTTRLGQADDHASARRGWRRWAILPVGLAVAAVVVASLASAVMLVLPGFIYGDGDFPRPVRPSSCPSPATVGKQRHPRLTASPAPTSSPALPAECNPITLAAAQDQWRAAITTAQNGVRQPIGIVAAAALAAIAAGGGVYINHRNVAQTEQHHAQDLIQGRAKADDDRFATAVEQLGNDAASVRVGALHSLYRLAASRPERAQTVMDVFCAYLRQPFHHPIDDWDPEDPDNKGRQAPERAWWPKDSAERDRRDGEREVRRTATRLIQDLLSPAPPPGVAEVLAAAHGSLKGASALITNYVAPRADLDVDLSRAAIDDLDLSDRRCGRLRAVYAHFAGNADLNLACFVGGVDLTGAQFAGDAYLFQTYLGGYIRLIDAHFRGDVKAYMVRFAGNADLTGAHFAGEVDLRGVHFLGYADLEHVRFDGRFDLRGARSDDWFNLEGTDFRGNVLLSRSQFGGFYCTGVHFAGNVDLNETKFDGGATFCRTHFAGDVELRETEFGGNVDLDDTHFHGNVVWAATFAHTTGRLTLRNADFCRAIQRVGGAPEAVAAGVSVALEGAWWSGKGERLWPTDRQTPDLQGGYHLHDPDEADRLPREPDVQSDE